jgi:two-component system sensor kinase FixL
MVSIANLFRDLIFSLPDGLSGAGVVPKHTDFTRFQEHGTTRAQAPGLAASRRPAARRPWPGLRRWSARAASDAQRWTDPVLAMLDDAIVGCTTAGRITYWSQGAETMFGYPGPTMLGQPVAMLASADQAGLLRAVLSDCAQDQVAHRDELLLRRRDGATLPVALNAARVHDGDGAPIGVSLLLRDASPGRRLADAQARIEWLQNQNARLSRLTATERTALNLAHELNQPLSAIINYVRAGQRLMVDPALADSERLATAFEGAMAQALHAGRIVGRLRAFVTHGECDKRVERVAALVEGAVALAMPETGDQRISLSLALDPAAAYVLVDRVQIEQVLVNLIRNALEAMRDCPRRVLSIASRVVDGAVEISVRDSGKGLPAAMRDRLFEPFVTTRRDGTGLGLTICQAIVEAHGGRLSCDCAPEGGSVFRFTVTGAVEASS